MEAIWKTQIQLISVQEIELPVNAKVLCVQMQNNVPCIWFINRDVGSSNKTPRIFKMYGTGHQHNEITGSYIGTFQIVDSALVFHLFEV